MYPTRFPRTQSTPEAPELTPTLAADNLSAPWEVTVISLLLVALQARDARIRRLEELDRQKAVYIDEQRRRAQRRAA